MSDFKEFLSSIDEVIEDARNGRMFVLVDAEERENEGDLVIPAQMCTPDAVNFMARFGRGLICLALTKDRANQLQLKLMPQTDSRRRQTAFAVSIEAREGVSTGISAHDRAHTIAVAVDTTKSANDIVTPGHVFPLVSQDGGVLVRAGHTEAAVDIARLAGLYPAGVICEVMNDDGTMARLPDLVKFAQLHGLKVATISDLIAYRRRQSNLVRRRKEFEFGSVHGGSFNLIIYENVMDGTEHIVLVKGDISGPEPVLVRAHALNVFSDLLGSEKTNYTSLADAMRAIDEEGRGVLMLFRDTAPNTPSEVVEQYLANEPVGPRRLRYHGIGAQILLDLGVQEMVLLSNSPEQIFVGLEGYNLKVVGQRSFRLTDPRAPGADD